MVDVINQYVRFPLPRHWGGSRTAIADGTHVKLHENNLIGSRHIRYGGYGGIAYHHIANTYIALFTSFISCGVWEAVYILDGLMKNRSAIQPETLHADTQGQSEPVFGLCRLLGIKLMPRMRGLSDTVFYRPTKTIRYQHIDALFGGEIDWELIATHARDLVQVVLSIQAGVVMPSHAAAKARHIQSSQPPVPSSWRIASSEGSGRLHTRLDTPPFSRPHHPVFPIAPPK